MDANGDSERRLADITLDPRGRASWEISHWQNLHSASRASGHSLSIFQCSSIHSQGSVADIVLLQLRKSICLFISYSSQLYNFWQCPEPWQRDAKMNESWCMLPEIDLKLLKYKIKWNVFQWPSQGEATEDRVWGSWASVSHGIRIHDFSENNS